MTLFLAGIALILAGGMSTVVTRRSRRATSDAVYQSLVVAGCVAGAIAANRVILSGMPRSTRSAKRREPSATGG